MADRFNEPSTPNQQKKAEFTPPVHCSCGELAHVALARIDHPRQGVCFAPASGVMYQDKQGWQMKSGYQLLGFASMCADCFFTHTLNVVDTTDGWIPKEPVKTGPKKAEFTQGLPT